MKIADDDIEERKATLKKRKARAAEMETGALELGAARRLANEEEDLNKQEAAAASMRGKLEALERRFEEMPRLAWAVFEQLGISKLADKIEKAGIDGKKMLELSQMSLAEAKKEI